MTSTTFTDIDAQRLEQLRGAYSGERCFIMGNGPSLNDTPLELLGSEYVWGVNRCHLLYDRIGWRPQFYASVDARVGPAFSAEIFAWAKQLTETRFFLPADFRHLQPWADLDNIHWFRQIGQQPELGPDGYFSDNPAEFLRAPNTVIITCIQLAVYLGFNPIYLIGCDTRFHIPETLVEASGEVVDPGTGEVIKGYELVMKGERDPNHFHPDYFKKGDPWTAPNIAGQIFAYQLVKKKCDARGVQVFNATTGGDLEVFPRIPLRNLFNRSPELSSFDHDSLKPSGMDSVPQHDHSDRPDPTKDLKVQLDRTRQILQECLIANHELRECRRSFRQSRVIQLGENNVSEEETPKADTERPPIENLNASLAETSLSYRNDDALLKKDMKRILKSRIFDSDYYLEQYPDVKAAGLNPLVHYLQYGAMEGRNPSRSFHTFFYLKTYPGIAKSGINPLLHYVRFGKKEGRFKHPSEHSNPDTNE